MDKIHNIALFIDGDNVCKSTFQTNFNEIKLRGRICIKRIYFDFTNKMDDKWKSMILNNGIESISVINLPNKNSTDIKLMLDMIKEFYSNPIIDTYIIMSSDSDFYHIATFLRSNGKKVICYGEPHTPLMLKNVCDEFVLCVKNTDTNNNVNNNSQVSNGNLKIELFESELYGYSNDEDNIYQEIKSINPFFINKSDIKHSKWTKYSYYKEYKNKIYILKETILTIKLIYMNKNLENKNLSSLKDLLIRSDSSFSEKNWGFFSFKDFINCLLSNVVTTGYDPDRKIEVIQKINLQ